MKTLEYKNGFMKKKIPMRANFLNSPHLLMGTFCWNTMSMDTFIQNELFKDITFEKSNVLSRFQVSYHIVLHS